MNKKGHMKRSLAALSVLAFLTAAGCGSKEEMQVPALKEPAVVQLDTEKVIRGELINAEALPGSLVPLSSELYFELDGNIGELSSYPGKWVEEGELLMSLNSTALDNRIASLESSLSELDDQEAYEILMADLELQYLNVELQQILSREGESAAYLEKQLEIETRELQAKHAQESRDKKREDLNAELSVCRENEEKTSLYAPHEGYVYYSMSLAAGSSVKAGHSIAYVVNANDFRLQADTYLTEADMNRMNVYTLIEGKRYELELEPMSYDELLSRSLSGQKIISSFRVVGEGSEKLVCGQYAEMVKESVHLYDVLLLPVTAIRKDNNGSYVYVITEDGREQRYISVGKSNGAMSEITEGLEEGEEVYVQD